MGALMQAYDWEKHPLGAPSQWPQSLQANIRLLLNSRFPMFIWWSGDFYMFHNDAYLPALGKKHPAALGASARDMWAEIWDEVGGIAETILQQGNSYYAENLLLYLERKGYNEETYWTFSYSPAFDDAGNVAGMFCACSEVTDSMLGQRRLNTLRETSDAMTPVYTLDQACQHTCDILARNTQDIPYCFIYLLNGSATEARLAGKAGSVAGAAIPDALNLSDLSASADSPFAEAIRRREPVVVDDSSSNTSLEPHAFFRDLPGRTVILPVHRPDHQQIIGFFVAGISSKLDYTADYQNFHRLITGQIATSIISIQAREAVMKQQETLHEMFQQAPVGITILRGPDHIIDLANPGVCEIWGRRQEDIIGRPVLEALPEVANQGVKQLLDDVFYTGIPFVANELPFEFMRNGKSDTVYLNFVYQPVRDAHGAITGIIAVAIDINEQVAARREIETMNKELMAINADLDNFVYSASHDLKAPISNIEGLMHALLDFLPNETLENPTVQRLTQMIHSSILRFKRALTDLTEVAKIQREAGDDVYMINLSDAVSEVLLDFESVIQNGAAIIELDMEEDLALQYSAKNLRSIVYNLVSNALKYHKPNQPPRLHISTTSGTDYITLSVRDEGLGMNLADESKIFSMFKRLHDHVEGSGIGLYIVKRIVENAGGKIEVESQPGEGATFRIFFKR